jgi:hypothetical protein
VTCSSASDLAPAWALSHISSRLSCRRSPARWSTPSSPPQPDSSHTRARRRGTSRPC